MERHWERAGAYLRQGQVRAARVQLESLHARAPDDARTHLLAARIAWREDHPAEAAAHALEAARFAPDAPGARCDVIETLLLAGEPAAAHALLEREALGGAMPADVALRHVDLHHRFGEHAAALAILDRLLGANPADGALRSHRGQQLEFLGRRDEAASEYTACLRLAPGFARAAYQLARLHRRADAEVNLALVEHGLRSTAAGTRDHAEFEFARYHLLEDLGRFDAAWAALASANAAMHALTGASAARQQANLRRFHALVSAHPAAVAHARASAPRPIFMLGLPRSGTTVLERMLGNHPQVASGGELVDFGQQLLRVADTCSNYSDTFFTRLPTLDLAEVGRRYRAQTAWRAHGRPCLVDKQPANWMLAGLIHAAVPDAKILHLVRDPLDVCFSNFRARFVGDTFAWSYDLAALADQYRAYRGLMALWRAQYPGAILDVPYAALVQRPEETLRGVLDFCGLAWEPGCEDLTRNTAPVSTLSASAVREPVHARALGEWRRYAAQLEPLRRRLESVPIAGAR